MYRCPNCDSQNLTFTACGEYNPETQSFEYDAHPHRGDCKDCDTGQTFEQIVTYSAYKGAPTCPECGSTDIVFDAFVRFNPETQKHEVCDIMDQGHCCNACNATDIQANWPE